MHSHSTGITASDVRKAAVARTIATVIIVLVMLAQYSVFVKSGSHTVRNDLAHSLLDAFSYILAIIGVLALLRSASGERFRERCALISAILFMAAGLYALKDLFQGEHPHHLLPDQMLLVGVVGLIGNLAAHYAIEQTPEALHGHDHELFKWHNLFDMFFSLLVIAAVACIKLGMPRIDIWLGGFGGTVMIAYGAYVFSRILNQRPHSS